MSEQVKVPDDLKAEYKRLRDVRYEIGSCANAVMSVTEAIVLIERIAKLDEKIAGLRSGYDHTSQELHDRGISSLKSEKDYAAALRELIERIAALEAENARLFKEAKDYENVCIMQTERIAELKVQVERLCAIPTSEEIPCGERVTPKQFQEILAARKGTA
jgi:hypothetical protein